jgi:hypothetical protein
MRKRRPQTNWSVAYWERRGSRGHWHKVGFKRIADALRAHGVILLTGDGEGVRRVAVTPPSSG